MTGLRAKAILYDGGVEAKTALDASPSVKPAALLMHLFLNQQSCAFRTGHASLLVSSGDPLQNSTAFRI
jgi:hypothetical protein